MKGGNDVSKAAQLGGFYSRARGVSGDTFTIGYSIFLLRKAASSAPNPPKLEMRPQTLLHHALSCHVPVYQFNLLLDIVADVVDHLFQAPRPGFPDRDASWTGIS